MSAWVLMYLFVIVDQLREAMSNYPGGFAFAVCGTLIFCAYLGASRASIDIDTRTLEQFDDRWEKLVNSNSTKWFRRILILLWIIPVMMFTAHTLLPTQKNLAILIGAGVTYEAVTSESGKRIGGKVIQLLEEKLDQAMEGGEQVPKGNGGNGEKEKVKKEEFHHAT